MRSLKMGLMIALIITTVALSGMVPSHGADPDCSAYVADTLCIFTPGSGQVGALVGGPAAYTGAYVICFNHDGRANYQLQISTPAVGFYQSLARVPGACPI